jgi:outer membrane biosynthesis protein TonB
LGFHILGIITLAWFFSAGAPGALTPQVVTRPELSRYGVCEREGVKIVGRTPARVGKGVRAPRKLRDAKPQYPDLPANTVGSGMWIGEFLVDTHGKVARVWTVREVEFTPPFPAFNQAIVDALKKWEFTPVVVKGDAIPLCTTVTVSINWR